MTCSSHPHADLFLCRDQPAARCLVQLQCFELELLVTSGHKPNPFVGLVLLHNMVINLRVCSFSFAACLNATSPSAVLCCPAYSRSVSTVWFYSFRAQSYKTVPVKAAFPPARMLKRENMCLSHTLRLSQFRMLCRRSYVDTIFLCFQGRRKNRSRCCNDAFNSQPTKCELEQVVGLFIFFPFHDNRTGPQHHLQQHSPPHVW